MDIQRAGCRREHIACLVVALRVHGVLTLIVERVPCAVFVRLGVANGGQETDNENKYFLHYDFCLFDTNARSIEPYIAATDEQLAVQEHFLAADGIQDNVLHALIHRIQITRLAVVELYAVELVSA